MILPLISFLTFGCVVLQAEENVVRVTSLLAEPYLEKNSNGEYEGFIVDILDKIFDGKDGYKLTHREDLKYGSKQSGEWDGMIGEIIDNKADLAAAPLTVTDERKKVISFTSPFMKFDYSALMLRDSQKNHSIKSLDDLAKQDDITIGMMREGSTNLFFANSQKSPYKEIFKKINHDSNVNNYKEGVDKVLNSKGKFAMIMESPHAKYWVAEKACELVDVEGKGENRQYALVVNKENHDLKKKVDEKLKELGDMQAIKDKWWKSNSKCNSALRVISVNFGLFFLVFFLSFLF